MSTEHDGKTYYSVIEAARLLSTNGVKIKRLMGSGDLEWEQFRVNGPLWISAASIVDYERRLAG